MMAKFILPAVMLIMAVNSLAASRIKCPQASDVVPAGKTLVDYQSFFSQNRIIPKTELTLNYVEQFKNEFEKFPPGLRQELIKAGNKIHIMEGPGVTVDPTWEPTHEFTFDGRPWSEVPGGGGSTARGYRKSPTRVVINHLYDKQGSANMFLHEHGHSLDSIRELDGISRSDVWNNLLVSEPNSKKFLDEICGKYCTENENEGFAELFANYHGCEASRAQLERELPKVADFFRRFRSTRNLDRIWETETDAGRDDTPRGELRRRVRNVLGRIIPNDDA